MTEKSNQRESLTNGGPPAPRHLACHSSPKKSEGEGEKPPPKESDSNSTGVLVELANNATD